MKSLKNYIIEKHYNSPDSIQIKMGKGRNRVFDFKDETACPFIYVMKKSKVLFGDNSQTHSEFINELQYNKRVLCKKLGIQNVDACDPRWDPDDSLYDTYEEWVDANKPAAGIRMGRTWDIVINGNPSLFIAWWNELSDKEFLDYNKIVIDEYFTKKLNTDGPKDEYKFYCLDNNGKIFEYDSNKQVEIEKRSDKSKELLNAVKIIHLATQNEKQKFFADFKKSRDEKNQKIYNHTKSKTEAEYRSLKYQESLEQ